MTLLKREISLLLEVLDRRARREGALSDALVSGQPRDAALMALAPVREAVLQLIATIEDEGVVLPDSTHQALAQLDVLVGATGLSAVTPLPAALVAAPLEEPVSLAM